MAKNDFDDIGQSVINIIQEALDSKEFNDLSDSVKTTINETSKEIRKDINDINQTLNQPQPLQLYAPMTHNRVKAILMIIIGYILGLYFCLSLFLMPVGILLFFLGRKGRLLYSRVDRFQKYIQVLDKSGYAYIKDLSRKVKKSKSYVKSDIKDMINDGWFIYGKLDNKKQMLFVCDEVYDMFIQELDSKNNQNDTSKQVKSELDEIIETGNQYIQRIHQLNEVIPEEEISQNIDKIEIVIKKIFDRVKQHPENVSDIRKLMKYYLPTTIKLLETYSEMEGMDGENIENSKREIEKTIETLNIAFSKLLDDMFQETVWDVSSDISVLESLLAQDGLTDNKFGKD